MCKPIFILLMPLLACLSLCAQEKQLVQEIGWRGSRIELHTICNKPKQQSCTFIVKNDSTRALVFNNKAQIMQQFNLTRDSKEKILGGCIHDGKVYLFTENADRNILHNYALDIATGNTTEKILPFDLKKEKTVTHISCGDRFLYFTVNKKTSEFIIYNFTGEEAYTTIHYPFEDGIWKDLTRADGTVSVAKVDLEGECDIEVAIKQNKLYPSNDTLLLLMDNKRGLTTVYSFDLIHNAVNHREITHPKALQYDSTTHISENTFLSRNKLYYVCATSDSLSVQVVDFYTGSVIKSFDAGREDTISFKNTPITQEGSTYVKGIVRELGKTKQLLRKMVNGDAVITATPNYVNQVEISVGSYNKVSGLGNNGGYWMPSGTYGSGTVFIPTGGFARNSWTKSARFKMLLNADTYEFVPGTPGNSVIEKIEYATAGIKIPSEGENLFMLNGRYYYAYYDRDDRRLVVMKF